MTSVWLLAGLTLFAVPVTSFAAVNPDCTLIVPANPLTAAGLATPYRLTATNPANGPCHETNTDQSAFVQAAVINLLTGKISIYNPLVIDSGTLPAAPPVVPVLPPLSIVAVWFGYNGDHLTLKEAVPGTLAGNDCHQGMGQFAHCNAPGFFAAAYGAILVGALNVPPLALANDGQLCPSVRSFAVVDQDQSDNLPTTYLQTVTGRLAQNTAANAALFPGATVLKNASDNGLTNVALDSALGCTPWTAPDLANPGHFVPALPLNELQAAEYQPAPVALIPLGDPLLDPNAQSLAKVNEYRLGVGQLPAIFPWDASQTIYCANVRSIASWKLHVDRPFFIGRPSPNADTATNLFAFMAQRLDETYTNLNCQPMLGGLPSPVTVIRDAAGKAIDAVIH